MGTLCFTMATAPRVGSVATRVRRLSKTARRNAAAPLHADTSRIRNPVRKKLQEQTVRCIALPANAKMIIITQSTTRTASPIERKWCQPKLRVAIAQLAIPTMGRRAAKNGWTRARQTTAGVTANANARSRGEALRVVIARLAFPTMAQRAAKGRTRARQTTAGVTANANARSFLLRQKGATTLCFTMATAPRVGSVATRVRRLSKTARRNAAAPLHADTSRIRNPVRKKLQEQTVRCIAL